MPCLAKRKSVYIYKSKTSLFTFSTRPPAGIAGCTKRAPNDAVRKLGLQPTLSHTAVHCAVASNAQQATGFYRPESKPSNNRKVKGALLKEVTAAVQGLGGSATAGDVSAVAGVSMKEAEDVLAALVASTGGTLKVEPSPKAG